MNYYLLKDKKWNELDSNVKNEFSNWMKVVGASWSLNNWNKYKMDFIDDMEVRDLVKNEILDMQD